MLWPWSPTNNWPVKGPNPPPVSSVTISDVEMPRMEWGSHTDGVLTAGNSFSSVKSGVPLSAGSFSGLMGCSPGLAMRGSTRA